LTATYDVAPSVDLDVAPQVIFVHIATMPVHKSMPRVSRCGSISLDLLRTQRARSRVESHDDVAVERQR
jgi:hypothetical protein